MIAFRATHDALPLALVADFPAMSQTAAAPLLKESMVGTSRVATRTNKLGSDGAVMSWAITRLGARFT